MVEGLDGHQLAGDPRVGDEPDHSAAGHADRSECSSEMPTPSATFSTGLRWCPPRRQCGAAALRCGRPDRCLRGGMSRRGTRRSRVGEFRECYPSAGGERVLGQDRQCRRAWLRVLTTDTSGPPGHGGYRSRRLPRLAGSGGGLKSGRDVVELGAVKRALAVWVRKAWDAVRAHAACPPHLRGYLWARRRRRLLPAGQ